MGKGATDLTHESLALQPTARPPLSSFSMNSSARWDWAIGCCMLAC